jgi:hypothetical protein
VSWRLWEGSIGDRHEGPQVAKVQGISLTDPGDLAKAREALSKIPGGQEIKVTLLRSGRVMEPKARRPKG